MEKPTSKPNPKSKKKVIQITYPAPYSLSWNPDMQPVPTQNKVGVSTSLFHRSKRPQVTPRAYSQQFSSDRPDRTAAHLKCGVFQNRYGAPPKPMPKLDTHPKMNRIKRLASPVKRNRVADQVTKLPQNVISRGSSIAPVKPTENVSVRPEFPPKFVFRNLNKSYSKELTFSRVSHMDIKPKVAAPLSPIFRLTPTFRSSCRKSTLTPTKYRIKEAGP